MSDLGHNGVLGYYSQHRAASLDPERTVLEEVVASAAAMTTSAMAWRLLSRAFHSKPHWLSAYDTTPMLGENKNNQTTPATAGATA